MRTRAVSRCPDCGRELTVPKPAPLLDAEFASWEPRSIGHQRRGDREPRAGCPALLRVPEWSAGDRLRLSSAGRDRTERGPAQGQGDGGRRDRPRGHRLPADRRARSCPRSVRPARRPAGPSAPTTSSRSASRFSTTRRPTAACRPPRSPTGTASRSCPGGLPSSRTWNRALSTRGSISTSPGTVPTTSPSSTRCRWSTPARATATGSPG